MKNIEIEDDLYQFIASKTRHIGESASDILRRLVMPDSVAGSSEQVAAPQKNPQSPNKQSKLLAELAELHLLEMPTMVNRFLAMLSLLHKYHTGSFASVLTLSGRNRRYFATSEEALLETGSSTNPKQVPNSEYWVITNNNTQKKVTLLKEVALLLGYSGAQIEQLVSSFCPELEEQ